jgi:ribosome-associated toxin RatA of RatAB toxin-antitoxin module
MSLSRSVRIFTASVLVHASLWLPGVVPQTTAAPPLLSANELIRLQRGEIVFKNQLPPAPTDSAGNGGTAVALLQADSEKVWRILTDFEHYAGLFPRLTESRTVEQAGARTLVRFRVAVGPFSFRFFVAHVVSSEERQIRWRLDRSQENDLFHDTWGYWQLDPAPGGQVLVTYAMGSRTALPARLTRSSEQDSVVRTMAALKARVESPQLFGSPRLLSSG